ncbi:MAG: signal recognition particle protein [Caldilinea sp.]|nr:signal recognition particle protein [Caldilinea sp.]MCB0146549.1 signal recognition particle protein [Caldilineaceae bacterium]MCB9125029.1 signal recognition particle protein [Caldilineaceae bacterium]MCO5213116.1 signal recognition particle protein [Caldilinea sp.]MCW5839748.1 signal recognition particle protein [Caldilinea sp.]
MFESLTDKLQSVFDRLATKGKLTENDVNAAMREVRLALLEADVNYKVVKDFVERVKTRAVGVEVMQSLTPAQQVVKIVNEELIELLGKPAPLNTSGQPPHVIMLVGLQGAGKTTMAAKLALRLKKNGQRPLLVAADIYRPAAIKQLEVLGSQVDVPVFTMGTQTPASTIAKDALKQAREKAYNVVIVDTAGRLQIDDALMQELEQVRMVTRPADILLVVDAMTGQEAVNVAEGFNTRVPLTGLIMTKIDGDARGGAALSVREVTGVPIKFLGTGEKLPDLEPFDPERLAGRILGMGDVLTLIERAQENISEADAAAMEKRLVEGQFDFEDFLDQLKQVKRLGPISDILGMIPGMNRMVKDIDPMMAQDSLKKTEAIISSMTVHERRNPDVLNASRRRRIAAGSGTTVQDVNQLVKQFREMQKMMKQLGIMGRGKKKNKKGRGGMPGQRGGMLPSGLSDLFGGR